MLGKQIFQFFLMLLLTTITYAQNNLPEHLGPKQNPILAPEDLKKIPYVRLFLTMNVVPMIVWDKEGGLISANDAYLALIGYTRQEMLSGQIDWVTITPEEYRPLDKWCQKQLDTNEFCAPYVKEYIRKDGKRIPIKLWNARNVDKDGSNIAIILPLSTKIRTG